MSIYFRCEAYKRPPVGSSSSHGDRCEKEAVYCRPLYGTVAFVCGLHARTDVHPPRWHETAYQVTDLPDEWLPVVVETARRNHRRRLEDLQREVRGLVWDTERLARALVECESRGLEVPE